MKMKKGLVMVVLLLAISSIMAAMSYTSATVTSAMSGTVINTNEALLALDKGSHKATTIDNGVLKIDFNKGNVTSMPVKSYGLQKQSEYIWNGLFTIKNNSENVVDATIKTENNLPRDVKLYVKIGNSTWTEITSTNSFTHSNLPIAFKTNNTHQVAVDVKVVVGSNASLGNFAPNLVVSGTAK